MCSVTQAQGSSASGVAAPAALGRDTIVPLQIGDTIPEALWHLPLEVINHPEGKDIITLNDYRGRLILLDFWGIGCGSCILALPTLDLIQRQFPTEIVVLPTARQAPETLTAFWQKNNYTKSLLLPTLADQTYLHQYFPHISISHVVWITPQGTVYSATHTQTVNRVNIQRALSGHPPKWHPKIDQALLDHGQEPIVTVTVSESSIGTRSLTPYYSAMTGYAPDRPQKHRQVADSAERTILFTYSNVSLYSMILSSLGISRATISPSHILWRVNDRSRYSRSRNDNDVIKWKQANYYSYEAKAPLHTTDAAFRSGLSQDLKRFFPGLHFQLDTQQHACLKLVAIADLATIVSKGGPSSALVDSERPVKKLSNQRISRLVYLLNQHFDGTPVFDETGYTKAVDITLPVKDLSDITAVRNALREQGLDLQNTSREVITLTITDQPYTFTTY